MISHVAWLAANRANKQYGLPSQRNRGHGWVNWYIGRKRIPMGYTAADLRRVSWRRVL